MSTCNSNKKRAGAKGYRRQGTTGAKEKVSRSHSIFIVPQVVGEVQTERADVGKGDTCIYDTTK